VDAPWEKFGKILDFHEREFVEKIVPKNKLTPEMVEDFKQKIQHLRTQLANLQRTESSYLTLKASLNQLFVDLVEAAKLCGMDQIVIVSSSDVVF
jgi:hypothetical protein